MPGTPISGLTNGLTRLPKSTRFSMQLLHTYNNQDARSMALIPGGNPGGRDRGAVRIVVMIQSKNVTKIGVKQ